jgi:hypothetical protein
MLIAIMFTDIMHGANTGPSQGTGKRNNISDDNMLWGQLTRHFKNI